MLWDIGTGSGVYAPSKGVKESTIVDNIVKAIHKKYPKAIVYKFHGGMYQRAGIPDIHVQIQRRPVWIEVKRPDGDTTALQHRNLQLLEEAGAYVGTACSVYEAMNLIEEVLNFLNEKQG